MKRIPVRVAFAMAVIAGLSCSEKAEDAAPPKAMSAAGTPREKAPAPGAAELATLGGGCFWCVEAVFEEVQGVLSAESGYAGGTVDNPTYKEVCAGTTGHAEVCLISFDPAKISYESILKIFFNVHDPTTLNRQGNDRGTQYRSVIFTHSDAQKAAAEKLVKELAASGSYKDPIVTEIAPVPRYYPAEEYHQDYFRKNPDQGYCSYVVRPKVDKFRVKFSDYLKK